MVTIRLPDKINIRFNDSNVFAIKYELGVLGKTVNCFVLQADTDPTKYYILDSEIESVCNQIVGYGYFVARYVESPFVLVLVKNS